MLAALLPSVTAIGDSLARTTLRITGREDFGAHYAETLRIWRERFGAQAAEVARLGFDEVFTGCGPSTCATPKPASGPGTSTSASSPWPAHEYPQGRRRTSPRR
jgi:hypothetical protein